LSWDWQERDSCDAISLKTATIISLDYGSTDNLWWWVNFN
jgi:hypothetical protein